MYKTIYLLYLHKITNNYERMNKILLTMVIVMFAIVGHSQEIPFTTNSNGEIIYNGKKYALKQVSKNKHILMEVGDTPSFFIDSSGEFLSNGKNYVVKEYKGVKKDDLFKRFTKSYREFKNKYKDGTVEVGIDEIRYYVEIKSYPSGIKVEYLFKTTIQIDFKDEKIRIAPTLDKIICNGGSYNYNNQVLSINEFYKKNGNMKSDQKGDALFALCGLLNQAISDILEWSENVKPEEDW